MNDDVIYYEIDEDVEKKLLFISLIYKRQKLNYHTKPVPLDIGGDLMVDDIVVLRSAKYEFEFAITAIVDEMPFGRLLQINKIKRKKR